MVNPSQVNLRLNVNKSTHLDSANPIRNESPTFGVNAYSQQRTLNLNKPNSYSVNKLDRIENTMDNMYNDQSLNSYISSLSKPTYSQRNLQINPNHQPYSHRIPQGVVTEVNRNYTIPYNNDINSAVNQ